MNDYVKVSELGKQMPIRKTYLSIIWNGMVQLETIIWV